MVPRSAVLSARGQAYLFVVRDGHAVRHDVRTGLRSADDRVEVIGDIKPGDPVVSTGNYQLSDGMAVREAP